MKKENKSKMSVSIRQIVFAVLLSVFSVALTVGVSVVAYFAASGYVMYHNALENTPIEETVAEIRNREDYVRLSELPTLYTDGVVAVEDKDFYSHGGIDISSILRAVLVNIKDMAFTEGGSTITQQLAKNLFFTNDKVMERKAAEMYMAWKLESMYEKDEILELYVNIIYFGEGYTGIFAASEGYYGKHPSELDVLECAMLIGVPNAPACYSPAVDPVEAEKRRNYVLEQLVECGLVEEDIIPG